MKSTVKAPAVAGKFYPNDAATLQTVIKQFLQTAPTYDSVPKAMIVPHAGYRYSGPIAASAYRCLQPARSSIRRVILLGPSHRIPITGLAVPSVDYLATPLGQVTLDKSAIEQAMKLPQVTLSDQAHAHEHSLEVHLPFLQTIFNDFTVVPFVVGDASPEQVGTVLETLWGGPETLIVISSDLSHYHDYETAQRVDQSTSQAIEQLRFENISPEHACGRNPMNGLLYVARRRTMQVTTLDLRNSGDTAGSKHQVVGYGAYVFN